MAPRTAPPADEIAAVRRCCDVLGTFSWRALEIAVAERTQELPRRVLYTLLAFLLALALPLGLFFVRYLALHAGAPVWDAFAAEAATQLATYGYVFAAGMVILVLSAHAIGARVDDLRALSATDPLTNLDNRRSFEERLRAEVMRARRSDTPLALLFIDLDHLKTINDDHGHAAGDRALRAVAATLTETQRACDIAARIGGDELAVILPETTGGEAEIFAARLREVLLQRVLPAPLPALTVSIGVGELTPQTADVNTLMASADLALYLAKSAGRDRVIRAPNTGTRRLAAIPGGRSGLGAR